MDTAVRSLITALHAAPRRLALVLTGGGTSAAGWLLGVPGGSRTILEVAVPYDPTALADYLGREPDAYCSADTVRALARRAYDRACQLSGGAAAAGAAVSASLRSDRPKRGEHRCHLAVQTSASIAVVSLTFLKEVRERGAEEDVVDRLLLNALAESCGICERVDVPLLPGEEIVMERIPLNDALSRFVSGELGAVQVDPDGRCRFDTPPPRLLLPGSFNPLHEGHCRLAAAAAGRTGHAASFELAAVNAEKGMLPPEEIHRRLWQFAWRAPLWLTRAPTFAAKAALFPGTVFAIGVDTAARILQARFYGDSAEQMARALAAIRKHGCRFLVGGRVDDTGRFAGLADLSLSEDWHDLFEEIPAADFRCDASSTQIRSQSTVTL